MEERKRKPVYFPNGLRTRHQSEAVDRGETSPCDLDLAEYQLAALGSRGAAFAGGKTDRFLKRLLPATSLLVQIGLHATILEYLGQFVARKLARKS